MWWRRRIGNIYLSHTLKLAIGRPNEDTNNARDIMLHHIYISSRKEKLKKYNDNDAFSPSTSKFHRNTNEWHAEVDFLDNKDTYCRGVQTHSRVA